MSENSVTLPPDEPTILIERRFDAPRSLVWRCYTEPGHLVGFWGPRDAKTTTSLDLHVGGAWVVRWDYEGGGHYAYTSVYLEITPVERLVWRDAPDGWTGELDGLPPVTLLSTLSLAEEGPTRTRLDVQVRCNTIAERDETVRRGFAGMVSLGNDRLAEYLASSDPALYPETL